jgi:hypothetical protein
MQTSYYSVSAKSTSALHEPLVNVMITIFDEKNGFFLKTPCYDHIFAKKHAVG